MPISCLDRLQQLRDCLALVAARFEVGFKLKWHSPILAQHRPQRRGLRCFLISLMAMLRANRILEIGKIAEIPVLTYAT
jgi:hypothetical protein